MKVEENIIIADKSFDVFLLEAYLKSHSNDFIDPLDARLSEIGTSITKWAKKLSENATIIYAKNTESNEIMGMVIGYLHNLPEDKGSYLALVTVDKKYRRRHLAFNLIQKYLEYGGSLGIEYVWLRTETNNFVAQSLYESIGFRRVDSDVADRIKYVYMLDSIETKDIL